MMLGTVRLDHVRGAEMLPVLGGEVEERQQHVGVLLQHHQGPRVLRTILDRVSEYITSRSAAFTRSWRRFGRQNRQWPCLLEKLSFSALDAKTRERAEESRVAGGDERSEHALDASERSRNGSNDTEEVSRGGAARSNERKETENR